MKRSTLFSLIGAALFLGACANPTKTMTCQKPARGYYCVQTGDTLYRLSQRFGVPIADLRQWNELRNDQIRQGQILQVSASARKRGAAATAAQMGGQTQAVSTTQTTTTTRLLMPVNGFVIRNFGGKNYGIDIAAQRGMPVVAAAEGVVLYVGEAVPGYGRLVLVRHSNTLLTAYGNNDTILVPQGVRVAAGQPIATVGSTGRTDGQNALHFEVRVNGKAVNPESFLR